MFYFYKNFPIIFKVRFLTFKISATFLLALQFLPIGATGHLLQLRSALFQVKQKIDSLNEQVESETSLESIQHLRHLKVNYEKNLNSILSKIAELQTP